VEAQASLAKKEAQERVLQAEAKSATLLAFIRVEAAAQKVTLLEGELV
jgi:hypothetical protein